MRVNFYIRGALALLISLAIYYPQAKANPTGVNLTEVTDYSPQLPFTNLFKISREWFTQCTANLDPGCNNSNSWDTNESNLLDLDSSGWIKSLPQASAPEIYTAVATFWDVPSKFPAGKYIVSYEGSGTIVYGLGATKVESESATGRDVILVNPKNGGILLRLAAINPANYIRNISVLRQEDELQGSTELFSETFLQRLAPYSTLRFMDWMRTNNSEVSSWSDRALTTDARFSTEKGVPVETMVALSNETGKAPWFNMPHQADNEYIQNFATSVRESIDPGLNIYVEYSNEVWNSAFLQGNWIEQQGELLWSIVPDSPFTKRINYHGKRSAEICDIWKNAFSGDSARVLCVIASQAANSWTASEALDCPLWEESPCYAHGINKLAIAPYFGNYLGESEYFATVNNWTNKPDGGLKKIFQELLHGGATTGGPTGGSLTQSFEWIEQNKVIAEARELELVTYEGGQHLVGVGEVGNEERITTLFTAANRDARMAVAYRQYLAGWSIRGGGLFMHFNDISPYSRYGSWGAFEEIGQTHTPKAAALRAHSLGESGPFQLTLRVKGINGPGNGRIKMVHNGSTCNGICFQSLDHGQNISLKAKPSNGYIFQGWTGACLNQSKSCSLEITQDLVATALFKKR